MLRLKNFTCLILFVSLIVSLLPNTHAEAFVGNNTVSLKESETVMEYGNYESYIYNSPLPSAKISSTLIEQNTWEKIYTANGICVGLLDDDSLWEWRAYDESSNILMQDNFTSPVKMLENISDVAIGQGYILALASDKKLWAWGSNNLGELGDGSGKDQLHPQNIMNDVIKICTSKDSSSSFAIKSDGSLWGWGYNVYGQLGDKTNTSKNTPVKIMEGVTSVVGGPRNTLAIKNDKSLWAWGYNNYGQLGNGTYETNYIPVKIMEDIKKAAIENGSCFAVDYDSTLWSWGNNEYLQLPRVLDLDKRNSPIKALDNVSDVIPAMDSVYVIKLDNSLYAWGTKTSTVFNTKESLNNPKMVKLADNITKVSAYYHLVALDENGSAWTFGNNDSYTLDEADNKVFAPSLLSDNVTEIATDYAQSSYIKSDGSLFQVNYYGPLALAPVNIAVEPYINSISISNNFVTIEFSGAPLDSVSESDFTISSVATDEAGQTVTGSVNSSIYSFDQNTNTAVLQLLDIPHSDKGLISFNVSYKGHLAVNAKEIAATATITPTPTSTSIPTPFSTPKATTTCTLKPTATSNPTPTAFSTLQPTTTPAPTPTAFSTLQPTSTPTPTATSNSKSSYTEHRTRKSQVPTVIHPTETIPGAVPLPSPVVNDVEYKKIIQAFEDEFTETFKKYEGIDDSYNEKNELITKMAEEAIEKIATQKVICKNGSMEIKQDIILPQIELALKTSKDIKDFLAAQPYEPNRVIRKRINIDVDLTETQLTINLFKDVNSLVKNEVDIKISTKFGNIIIPYENIERLLNKDLVIIMTDEKASEDTKIKSKINLLFKYADGTIIEKLNAKIELELSYGDGNPDYCTIYNELPDNLYNSDKQNSTKNTTLPSTTASLLKMQSSKIELAFPRGNGTSDSPIAYGVSNTKKYNMGGYENTDKKTLRISTVNCGKYYVIEEKVTFHDIKDEDASVKEAIELLAVKGIINGRDDGSFHPDGQLKRSELASLIVRCLNIIDESASTNLKDVKKTAWYYNAVAIACEEGLISGYENNTFQGNKIINRQEITTICSNTLNIKKGYSFSNEDKWLNFSDKGIIPMWARKFIALGNREGIVIKRTDRKFNGTGLCTRKDAAVILYRFYKKL